MKILVNGKEEEINKITVMEYIHKKQLVPEQVVVELNYEVVSRDTWGSVKLSEADKLEILMFMGGGCK